MTTDACTRLYRHAFLQACQLHVPACTRLYRHAFIQACVCTGMPTTCSRMHVFLQACVFTGMRLYRHANYTFPHARVCGRARRQKRYKCLHKRTGSVLYTLARDRGDTQTFRDPYNFNLVFFFYVTLIILLEEPYQGQLIPALLAL